MEKEKKYTTLMINKELKKRMEILIRTRGFMTYVELLNAMVTNLENEPKKEL